MNPLLRRWLTGIAVKQEYLCLALEDLDGTFSVHLTTQQDRDARDVTATHRFLGYSPLVLAMPFAAGDPAARAGEICLSFNATPFSADDRWRDFPASHASIARLHLRRIHAARLGESQLVFYEGVHGEHRLLGAFHQFMNRQLERFRKRPAGNVTLHANLYDQVRIAYSLPRIISLVSVGERARMNLFPTDLHGAVGETHYVSSLRVGGQACQQVEATKRVVISEIAAEAYQLAYRLGKNHMKPLQESAAFELHSAPSATLGIGLPQAVVRYRELEWFEHFDCGIHRMFSYRVLHDENLTGGRRLAHVHKYYAQWRADAGLATHYLVR